MNKKYIIKFIKSQNKYIQFETLESFLEREGKITRSTPKRVIYFKNEVNCSTRRSAA
jgi:hypothetical protein